MRDIVKGQEPRSLTNHRERQFSDYDNYHQKSELRESLVQEQRGLCCYCLCRIDADLAMMKVEHWHPRSSYPQEQLDYENLLGACKGGEKPNREGERREDRHCDTFKEDEILSLNPAVPAHQVEKTISYLPDGRIRSSDPQLDAELSSVVNLNSRTLINRRKEVLRGFVKIYMKRPHKTKEEWQHVLRDWNGETHDDVLRPYAPVVVFYIRKYILRTG